MIQHHHHHHHHEHDNDGIYESHQSLTEKQTYNNDNMVILNE